MAASALRDRLNFCLPVCVCVCVLRALHIHVNVVISINMYGNAQVEVVNKTWAEVMLALLYTLWMLISESPCCDYEAFMTSLLVNK